jgi:transcriptional regulator with GAF, ATPase, and Fis domain
MNRRARELLGQASSGELPTCRETMNSSLCVDHCPLTEAIEGRPGATELELVYRGPRGDRRLFAQARMLLLRDAAGAPLAGIELFRDLTEYREMERALHQRRSLHGIIGRSAPMTALYELVEQVAPHDLPVLITGESGVGKERFADAIHALSERAGGPYVRVNCAALAPSLIESELFGHRRGSFTGASQDRRGAFEEAHKGTILLDEVGELPPGLQVKLLRVLQQGELQRVGEDRPRKVDVRVLAATNRDIEGDVTTGLFRDDLYYRLAGVRLHVPPLRHRREDIPLLVEHFLDEFTAESAQRGRARSRPELSAEAEAELISREWRGNVRELHNAVRLAWIRCPPGGILLPEHLRQPTTPAGLLSAAPQGAGASLKDLEQDAIQKAMDRSGGNIAAAARLLGIDRSTLWRKLKKGEGY